jgi:TIR domain
MVLRETVSGPRTSRNCDFARRRVPHRPTEGKTVARPIEPSLKPVYGMRTLREELTESQRQALDAVYEVFRDAAKWPQIDYVDGQLFDRFGIELRPLLESMPTGLVIYNRYGSLDDPIRLHVAGIACCADGGGDIQLFLRVLRWSVEKRQAYRPAVFGAPQSVYATAEEAARDWHDRGWEVSDILLQKAFEFLVVENLNGGWGTNPDQPRGWSVVLPLELRRYRDVVTLDDYLAVREQIYSAAQPVSAMPSRPASAPADPASVDAMSDVEFDRDQRDAITRMICDALCSRPWADIDALLAQHGLVPSQSEFGRFQYAEASLNHASSTVLASLSRELGLKVAAWEEESRNPWAPARFRLFCSHSSDDHEFVAGVAAALETYAISGFVAHRDIEPQAEWEQVIEYALGTADALVAFVNDRLAASVWCNQEIGWALGRRILPMSIMVGRSPVGFSSRFQGIPHSSDAVEQARGVFEVLARHRKTSSMVADSLVALLEESESWETATDRVRHLPRCRHWSQANLERLADAVRRGPKVADAWDVREAVESVFSDCRQEVPPDVKQKLATNDRRRRG